MIEIIKGEEIERTAIKIDDSQIILKEPKMIELYLFRDDQKKEFQIQLSMPPDDSIHTLETDKDGERARRRYNYLVGQLRDGKAKIEIGRRLSIVED